ncbi:ABC transporter permease [Cohnella candidum]|nr:ABC-2 family transporter protein [Cohnella candidum]
MRLVKLYWMLQMANIRSRSAYRLNFFIGIGGVGLVGIGNFILIWVLTRRVPEVQGWNYYQLIFLAALFQVTHGVFIITFQQIRRIEYIIREGKFDRFLIRPLNPLFSYATSMVTVAGFGDMSSGLIGMVYSGTHLHSWNAGKLLFLLLIVLSGALIQWALYTIVGCVGFWTYQAEGLRTILNAFLFQFNQFPLTVYNKAVQIVLSFVLGVAFISYFPSAMFFDKQADVPFSSVLVYAPPVAAVIMAAIAYRFWKLGLDAYKGAGS